MPDRTSFPLAYHITWGTYGTRLHGDGRGTVHRADNQFGEPIVDQDRDWQHLESQLLRFAPRVLTVEQRSFVETTFPSICARGGWEQIAIAAAPDHVHVIVSAHANGQKIRQWLKRWLSQDLSAKWPLLPKQVWWAECGSVKWIWDSDYYGRAVQYVLRQRTIPR